MSTRTLLRRFGDETGETPLAYLRTARVRHAGHLLETADRTVASIAAEVGYRDPGTFSGIFARHTGHRALFAAAARPPSEGGARRVSAGEEFESDPGPAAETWTVPARDLRSLSSRCR
ncbi:helix-turn-helix domain-containing protein [Streptomyces sp. 142MFCol3.1]|uniref:helix-turn-helix domain-containing protein n=1 Tax=Streptomyces sp. 142MFCol3.1 TaxID=1172179 RepID=UPI0003FB34ED|nr:helix-turn-helix domain-containing protein [Streptomyces sp. 142MFCol3.1]